MLLDHAGDVSFFAPDTAFDEAREHLPALLEKRGVTAGPALDFLTALEKVVRPIDAELYQPLEATSLARIGDRDPDDWPALACALLLDCPVWTEDADFFGTGVATWTTSRSSSTWLRTGVPMSELTCAIQMARNEAKQGLRWAKLDKQ